MRAFLHVALSTGIQNMSTEQIDAVLSFVPEMALPKITIGSTCLDKMNNRQLTVLGHYSQQIDSLHFPVFQPAYPVFTPAFNFQGLRGIDLSDESANIVDGDLVHMKPLLDASDDNCKLLA